MNDINYQNSNEIDLIELIKTLWNKKLWILLCSCFCTVIAGIYAFTAKEQWTSKAVVMAPKATHLGNYLLVKNEYASILDIKDFSREKVAVDLFNQFKTELLSRSTKEAFFAQSAWFNEYANKIVETQDAKLKLLSGLIEKNLIISFPDVKKDPNALGINVSFTAGTSSEAQSVLKEYINFVNKKVIDEAKQDLIANIDLVEKNLEIQKNKIERDSENIRKIQLENLATALATAKSAGIKDYSKSLNGNVSVPEVLLGDAKVPFSDSKLSDGSYLFMLGEKYLQAQVDTLKNAPLVYPLNYYNIEKQANLLNVLEKKVEKESAVSGYYYLSEPDYPVTKDKPKKGLIIVIGFVIGLIFSAFIILLSSLIPSTRKH